MIFTNAIFWRSCVNIRIVKTESGTITEYPVEIEAGGRASRLRVKFLRWLDH